ncbi:hypothetical protein FBR05_12710 [Deltaproteobacteria bacterium PRO3]|nr:hypothetical protein [Deltaproteobacteria bacterium PRO3]
MKQILWVLVTLCLAPLSFEARAEPTEVVVRVISKGAKFVGTDIGGARITIKELAVGKILAQGKTEGTTGDTDRIMRRAHAIGEARSDGGSAKFAATLDLDKPVYAEIRARGPMGHEVSANEASVTMWLLPGKHLRQGDAVLLEMPGLVVDLAEPEVKKGEGKAMLRAKVTMMCGCPITPGGLWNADKLDLEGLLLKEGKVVERFRLGYAGEASRFAAELKLPPKGEYEIEVRGFDQTFGNTGLGRVKLLAP